MKSSPQWIDLTANRGNQLSAKSTSRSEPDFNPSGRVSHDERGHAIWSWAQSPDNALFSGADLALVEDRVQGVWSDRERGFDPYQSGVVRGERGPAKRDLRELSKWIELRKQTTGNYRR